MYAIEKQLFYDHLQHLQCYLIFSNPLMYVRLLIISQPFHNKPNMTWYLLENKGHVYARIKLCLLCFNALMYIFQVSANMGSGSSNQPGSRSVTPALGISWANLVTTRLMATRTNQSINTKQGANNSTEVNVRTLEVMFAPHLPNSLCYYIIDNTGVNGLQ